MNHLLPALALFAATPALSADFTCRNTAAETVCDVRGCTVRTDGDFTPMELSRRGNRITLCAYSGCWAGAPDLVRTRGPLVLLHATVRREDGAYPKLGESVERVAVIHEPRARTALIRFGGFALAMTCD